jgi:ribosome-associated protein
MTDVAIRTETIRRDQFLKLANAVQGGGEAKLRVQGGEVSVNGEVETRRGRKLRVGDAVRIGQSTFVVAPAS